MYNIGYTQPCKGIQGLGGVLFVNEGWDDVYTISRCTDKTEKSHVKHLQPYVYLSICAPECKDFMSGLKLLTAVEKHATRGRIGL